MCIRSATTYASPVFAHATLESLDRLQVIQNKFCRDTTYAQCCVRNSIFHRNLERPTITKFMKDASKWFFDIADSHSNALLPSTASSSHPAPTILSVSHGMYLPINLTRKSH
ncbi:hypothetical protein EVAR_91409_1 [Eumeta japonica]|uniref:Uncharacterized protein n=1 Tax=Eumeta variegata TaxID=151549 RepID=A0A4C1XB00_EUMVA|nr:hypothetical protein EVAR_91409_1 [Eumeta japonica]